MDVMVETFKSWDAQTQLWFSLGSLGIVVLGLVLIVGIIARNVRIMVRGYPPPKPPTPQECNNDDNLTGVCLKPGGCKTTDECQSCVASRP